MPQVDGVILQNCLHVRNELKLCLKWLKICFSSLWSLFFYPSGTRIHNNLASKWTLNHLGKPPISINVWVFVYELSGCGFESHCSHLTFRYHACCKQGVPWHSGNYLNRRFTQNAYVTWWKRAASYILTRKIWGNLTILQ